MRWFPLLLLLLLLLFGVCLTFAASVSSFDSGQCTEASKILLDLFSKREKFLSNQSFLLHLPTSRVSELVDSPIALVSNAKCKLGIQPCHASTVSVSVSDTRNKVVALRLSEAVEELLEKLSRHCPDSMLFKREISGFSLGLQVISNVIPRIGRDVTLSISALILFLVYIISFLLLALGEILLTFLKLVFELVLEALVCGKRIALGYSCAFVISGHDESTKAVSLFFSGLLEILRDLQVAASSLHRKHVEYTSRRLKEPVKFRFRKNSEYSRQRRRNIKFSSKDIKKLEESYKIS